MSELRIQIQFGTMIWSASRVIETTYHCLPGIDRAQRQHIHEHWQLYHGLLGPLGRIICPGPTNLSKHLPPWDCCQPNTIISFYVS